MKMSVLRQGLSLETIDHIDCMKTAVGKDASDMILHARLHNATVLVGLQSGEAIVKPYQEGDETLRFADLYDSAISLHDFHRMQHQKVRSRDDLAPRLYELEILLMQERPARVHLRIKAQHQDDVPGKVEQLLRENIEFGRALATRLAAALLLSKSGIVDVGGPLKILDAAPADAAEWDFVDE
jgi:hypothetical protein